MSERTPTPWAYRPKKYDDWGFIRGADGDVACVARGETSEPHDAHRAAGTDPYGPNAAFIVKAVNNHDQLVEALTQALDRLEMIAQGRKPNATAFIPQIDAAIERARSVLASVSAPGDGK